MQRLFGTACDRSLTPRDWNGVYRVTIMLYLREDAYVEPLVNQWYAWTYLVPPLPYALYRTNTHLRLMKSFVDNPQVHILASADPALAGAGEFVSCTDAQVEEVRALLARADSEQRIHAELAAAVRQLDALVQMHRSGESIEPLYAKVPERLKGHVELFLDLQHQPSYRLIENLLYRAYYDRAIQSFSFGLLSRVKSRPFVLSTPRLADANHVQVREPFDSALWDQVFRSREQPASPDDVDRWFEGLPRTGGLAPRDLFTDEKPQARHEPVGDGVRIRYTGHAGFLIETRDTAILVDPVIASRGSDGADHVSFSELPPRIEYVCLTHAHSDHTNLETLLQLRYKVGMVIVPKNNGGTLADPSLRILLRHLGLHVVEVDDLDEIAVPSGRIVSIPFLGEHGDLNIRSKTAWLFELAGRRIYTGADSANLEPRMYEHVKRVTGPLDVLAIGMECVGAPYTWLYGALATTAVPRKIRESRRLNGSDFEKAVKMAETFEARQVLIYALGMEPWFGYFMGVDYKDDSKQLVESGKMLDYCASRGIPAERLFGRKTLTL